jgi:hypothetical protein
MKVSEITISRDMPFCEGIPGGGWMRGWRHRHPKLTLQVSQALETARARSLCRDNVKSFYDNLVTLYNLHNYSPDRIWNCDESWAQVGKNWGGVVIARTGARRVHSIVPDQREWLSVLVCINAADVAIPSFYIFRGKRFGQNYIRHCKASATMAMQPRAWMTSYLFSAWMLRFIDLVRVSNPISPDHQHLLILDGHISYVSVEVVQEARRVGLDILTLPSHTSHALQPIDVSIFKPFKQFFRQYRDYWMFRNLNEAASKDTLAQWVSLSLKKALTEENIKNGFAATGIWALNENAVDCMLAPSEAFQGSQDNMYGTAEVAGRVGLDRGSRICHAGGCLRRATTSKQASTGPMETKNTTAMRATKEAQCCNTFRPMMRTMSRTSKTRTTVTRMRKTRTTVTKTSMRKMEPMVLGTLSTVPSWPWSSMHSLTPACSTFLSLWTQVIPK